MNVLIVGGSGHVGSILRPALEARYACHHLDLRPVPGLPEGNGRMIVGDIEDPATLASALAGMQAVVHLAMAPFARFQRDRRQVDEFFDVNVRATYKLVAAALRAGIRRIVHTSTLSIYKPCHGRDAYPLDESVPAEAFDPYGLTKAISETVCEHASKRFRDAGIVTLRLMFPQNAQQMRESPIDHASGFYPVGPLDLQRAYVAALEATAKPGYRVVQITGDREGRWFPTARAAAELGWMPEGN